MKNTFINTVSSIGTGIFAGGIGAGVMSLHKWTRTGAFRFTVFLIEISIGLFVGYISQELTGSGAIAGLAGLIAKKFFDIIDEYSGAVIKRFIEKKLNIKLTKEEGKK